MGSGFESQGAHFKENPADSSESAGFLRSLNFIDFGLRYRYFPLLLQGTRPRFASDTLMSRRGISIPLRICGSGGRGISPVRWVAWWFSMCAPCLANWGGGRLSRFGVLHGGLAFCVWGGGGCRGLACCMVAECLGWCAVFSGSALRVSHGRSPQRSKEGRSVRVTGAPA